MSHNRVCCGDHHDEESDNEKNKPGLTSHRTTTAEEEGAIPPETHATSTRTGEHQIPEEMGFHVSVDVHSNNGPQMSNTNLGPENSMTQQDMRDEAAGYLRGATYRQNHEMEEMAVAYSSHADPSAELESSLYCNTSTALLETAIPYECVEDIKGKLLDQIDYQNVTIVRTTVDPEGGAAGDIVEVMRGGGNYSQSPSDVEYLSVDSFEIKGVERADSKDEVFLSAQQKAPSPGLSGKPDASIFKTGQSYENFDPQNLPAPSRKPAKNSPNKWSDAGGWKDDKSVAQSPKAEPPEPATDLYMNVPSGGRGHMPPPPYSPPLPPPPPPTDPPENFYVNHSIETHRPPTSLSDDDYVNDSPEMYRRK